MDRLRAQIDFLLTCDRLKTVQRTTRLHDGSWHENSAEHSWHLALAALTLAEHAPAGTNMTRVTELLIVHDLVEVHAGDAHFDLPEGHASDAARRERIAAARLFGPLPEPLSAFFHAAWEEFEAQTTVEARFAKAVDALQPMLLTWGPGGRGAPAHPELTAERLLRLKRKSLQDFPALWAYAQQLVHEAVRAGILPASAEPASRPLA